MRMLKAVIYTRVSTTEQAEGGTSLATQDKTCREWCRTRGYQVDALFSDAGESAKTSNRPQLIAMLAWVAKHKPAVVVVAKFDRWARNSTDHAMACAAIGKYGARLISATEAADDDPAGRLLQTILSGIAQFDNEVRAERVRTAMRETAMRGGWFTYPPYGYRVARAGSLPVLAEDPDRAPIVRDMFDGLATRRRTLAQTVAMGRELGIHHNSTRQMLRAPVYAGIIKSKLTDNREIQAAFPGLVSHETWLQAQAAQDGKRLGPRRQKPQWPLRGLLRCPECGSSITACASRGHGGVYEYYQCSRGHVRGRVQAVHEAFEAVLRGLQSVYLPIMQKLRQRVRARAQEYQDASRVMDTQSRDSRHRLQTQRDRLLNAYTTGAIDEKTFAAANNKLQKRIQAAYDYDHRTGDWCVNLDDIVSQCILLLVDPVALWRNLDMDGRRRFIDALYEGDFYLHADGAIRTQQKGGIIGALDQIGTPNVDMAYLAGLLTNLRYKIGAVGNAA